MKILVANIGSTSFKYRLLDMATEAALAEGKVERIGEPGSTCPDYATAIRRCGAEIAGQDRPLRDLGELSAIGFKAVHAGPLTGVHVVYEKVLAAMEEFCFFAPMHNPPYMAAMRAFQQQLPDVPCVAHFETYFFDGLSEAATSYAVPYEWRSEHGVRRYGFHGASHRAASDRVVEMFGKVRHISCHLGGSSSIAAVRDGVAVDTSFGVSAQSGLPQSNRVGDIDAFAVLFMLKKLGMTPDQMAVVLSSQSGLKGLSGIGSDLRDLEAATENPRARLALDVYVRAIVHYIGAFFVELGGLDVLSFSGGIGENSAEVRERVCAKLGAIGVEIDLERNRTFQHRGTISAAGSKAKVVILPADEEIVVARAVVSMLKAKAAVAGEKQ